MPGRPSSRHGLGAPRPRRRLLAPLAAAVALLALAADGVQGGAQAFVAGPPGHHGRSDGGALVVVRTAAPAGAPEEGAPEEEKELGGAAYYAGMLTSPMKEEDLEKDMVTPTLKFAGYATAAVAAVLLIFLASNGLIGGDPKSEPLPGF
mmetsp:Transcript_21736/g.64766  ORF Transcript_21736/g.64766 Transcript_21736/m.64766 type:complete len:149 (+) Transcript_21736:105-551(+)